MLDHVSIVPHPLLLGDGGNHELQYYLIPAMLREEAPIFHSSCPSHTKKKSDQKHAGKEGQLVIR